MVEIVSQYGRRSRQQASSEANHLQEGQAETFKTKLNGFNVYQSLKNGLFFFYWTFVMVYCFF